MRYSINSTRTLNNNARIPMLGFGTYKIAPGEAEQAVFTALKTGYRHIDTAAYYENEREVGNAVRKAMHELGIKREEIFVTTKLKNPDHDDPARAFEESFRKLNIGYIDLYLIHWPVEKVRNDTWKILEKILRTGKCRAIGVSNYTIRHLKELLEHAQTIPAVNQVEFSPFLYQKELLEFCNEHKIALEAYSPLTRGKKLGDERILAAAKKYNKSPAQILIRWALQHNIVVLPKSVHEERIRENAGVFDFGISGKDMSILDSLNEDMHVSWNPEDIP